MALTLTPSSGRYAMAGCDPELCILWRAVLVPVNGQAQSVKGYDYSGLLSTGHLASQRAMGSLGEAGVGQGLEE